MKKKIARYTLLLIGIISGFSTTASAQKKVSLQLQETTPKQKFYQGSSIGWGVEGLIGKALGSPIFNTEVQWQVNLKNRFLPVVEAGIGSTNTINEETQLLYKAKAPYIRIGADYNFMYKKAHLPGFLYGGLRIGASSFSYDVEGPTLIDPHYGKTTSIPISYQGISTTALWTEVVLGLRTKVYKNFAMGWSVRYKKKLSTVEKQGIAPWYIPGFGKNGSSSFNFTYSFIYYLPF